MAILPRFYVYVLARPAKGKASPRVFYVGKGCGPRVFKHEAEARRGCPCHKCNVIRKVWKEGGQIERYIVLSTDDEQAALDYERDLIALHGRENLCNHVDGGGGVPKPSEVTRAKMRASHLGKRLSDMTRAKMTERVRRQALDPEWRKRVSEGTKRGQARNPKFHERHAETLKERYADPEFRAKHAKITSDVNKRPDKRARQSESLKKRYENPEVLARQAEQARSLDTPERRAKVSARCKELWADPEHRAARLAAMAAARKRKNE